MIIKTGKKAGKQTQELVLKQPDWVQYFLSLNSTGKVASELNRHIADLDAKPFVQKCERCANAATRMSLYSGNALLPFFWCDTCDPYSMGARPGMLTIAKTFKTALRFVTYSCGDRRSDKRELIKAYAQAKGLPKRVGADAAVSFLP